MFTFIFERDLAILIEWWQQRIAWWELLNAACQIICIHFSSNFDGLWWKSTNQNTVLE
jgi:hypothetical protein